MYVTFFDGIIQYERFYICHVVDTILLIVTLLISALGLFSHSHSPLTDLNGYFLLSTEDFADLKLELVLL